MVDHYARLESAVGQLLDSVESLQQRVAVLEAGHRPVAGSAATGDGPGAREPGLGLLGVRAKRDPYDPIVMLSMIGRLFLVLAGGFFLRAMTEAGLLAPPIGIGLAFLYALLWLTLADRASRQGQSSSSIFHALGAALVAFPLLVEATTRFQVIGVAGSTLGLVVVTTAFLFGAFRGSIVFVPFCVLASVEMGVEANA